MSQPIESYLKALIANRLAAKKHFGNYTENLAFYEMFCMQHTLLRAKIIFLKSEMGEVDYKMQFFL